MIPELDEKSPNQEPNFDGLRKVDLVVSIILLDERAESLGLTIAGGNTNEFDYRIFSQLVVCNAIQL